MKRRIVVSIASVALCLSGLVIAQAGAATKTVSAVGGSVIFASAVRNAKTCAWSSNPMIAGFDKTVKCNTGTIARSARFKANTSTTTTLYEVTLLVRGKTTKIDHWKVIQAGKTITTTTTTTTTTSTTTTTIESANTCTPGPDADLSGCNFTNADLRGYDLDAANLSGANLTGANLSGVNLSEADLVNADLTGSNLVADFEGANLTGANLTNSDLEGAFLFEANLTNANFSGANLTGADTIGAILTGADFSSSILTNVTSDNDVGTPASLPSNFEVVSGYLVGPSANLSISNLTGADLSGADLMNTNLSSAGLDDANLTGANLTGANLSGAYLFGATLTGVISGDIVGTPGELPIGWQLINGTLVGP
jgi:uncharacterized protein YjbI with pentapeptide repeats